MKVLYPGHRYELAHLDGNSSSVLQFVQREPLHPACEGVTNQEVIRVVIDRVKMLNAEVPWDGNGQILFHLRMALALHENRALLRHVEKHGLAAEDIELGDDGHFKIGFVHKPNSGASA